MVRKHRLVTLAVAVFLSGCGTAVNTLWMPSFEGGMRPYGGVLVDAQVIKEHHKKADDPVKSQDIPAKAAAFFTADLPFSFVADTITLPITVPTWLILKATGADWHGFGTVTVREASSPLPQDTPIQRSPASPPQ